MDPVFLEVLLGVTILTSSLVTLTSSLVTLLLFPGRGSPWAPPPEMDPITRLRSCYSSLRGAVDALPVVVFIVDRNLLILDAVGGALPANGFTRGGLVGTSIPDHVRSLLLLDLYRKAVEGESGVIRFVASRPPYHSFIAASAPTPEGGAIVWSLDCSLLGEDADLQEIIARLRSTTPQTFTD